MKEVRSCVAYLIQTLAGLIKVGRPIVILVHCALAGISNVHTRAR